MWKQKPCTTATTIDPNREYSQREIDQIADNILREDARSELCRECGEPGEETGHVERMPQFNDQGEPLIDSAGNQLIIDYPQLGCGNMHYWYQGEGAAKGIGGKDPILFEEHFQSRRRREIYTSIGTPDPSIVAGIYNRTHPQGRKVNSAEQRKKNGASWYR
jgi:hypothetical protein